MKNNSSLIRLKGKKTINLLFNKGKTFRSKQFLLKILKTSDSEIPFRCGVSVGKRDFKKAVDRNRIKRQLRNVLQKSQENLPYKGLYMLVYKGFGLPETSVLSKELCSLLKKIKN